MPESMERAEENTAPELESQAEATPRVPRWTRGHTVWTLIIVSLIPGVVIAAFRNHWEDLPDLVQLATYATCAILIMIAVGLIIAPRDDDSD
jgi:DMSO reductase anchor subunit